MNPGLWGWVGVGVVVVIADAVAVHQHKRTMSSCFWHWREWSVPVLAGVVVHLVWRQAEA